MKGEGPRVGPIPPSRFLPLPGGRFGRETAAAAGGSRCPPPSFPPPPPGQIASERRVWHRHEPTRGRGGAPEGPGAEGSSAGTGRRGGGGRGRERGNGGGREPNAGLRWWGGRGGGARGRYVGGGRKGVPRRRCGSRVAVAERAGGTGGGPRGVARMGRTRASHAGWGHDGDTMGGGGDSTGVGDACRG